MRFIHSNKTILQLTHVMQVVFIIVSSRHWFCIHCIWREVEHQDHVVLLDGTFGGRSCFRELPVLVLHPDVPSIPKEAPPRGPLI